MRIQESGCRNQGRAVKMSAGAVSFFVPHAGCPHDCSFCDQRSISGKSKPPGGEDIRDALHEAIELHGERVKNMQIAFFGGSFTAIERTQMHSMLLNAADFCGVDGFSGIRISTRPDCINMEILRDIAKYPITDIELGAQSMDDAVLRRNMRGHTAQDTINAAAMIRLAGYRLTLQMMTGLLGDTPEGAIETAGQIAKLSPGAVRIYPVIVLRGTLLEKWYIDGTYTPPELDDAVSLSAKLLDFFTDLQIPVIRLGLHESDGIRDRCIAGPRHPAFRELCVGKILADKLMAQVKECPPKVLKIRVHPKNISALTGHGRRALKLLEQAGYIPTVMPDESLGYLEAKLGN